MANLFFTSYKQFELSPGVDLAGTVKVALVDTAVWTPLAANQFLSDVTLGGLIGTAQTLGTKSYTNGVFKAGNASWTGLVGAPSIEGLLFYLDTGVAGTSPLILFMDTATGLPTAAGLLQINAAWNAAGIYQIS